MPRRRAWLAIWSLPLVVGVAGGLVARDLWASLPDLEPLLDYRPALPSVVLDREGRPIAEFAAERRELVRLEAIPEPVVQAFLAAEDAGFWRHRGVDPLAMLRAAWVNLRAGEVVQGGSTVTQQLAKTLLVADRTLHRKLRDMALALRIESRLDKARILEIYLNDIYLGNGAYGVAAAARAYFDVSVAELTVSQAALLAGLVKAPSVLAPTVAPEAAEARRRWVLGRMHALGWLDGEAWRAALADRPVLRAPAPPPAWRTAAWFVEAVRRALVRRLGADALLRGGLVVETTLDLAQQEAALAAVRDGVAELASRRAARAGDADAGGPPQLEAALVAIDVPTGEVRALVGGTDFGRSQFNRATQARRQPGSAFKPFVYGAALELGFRPWTTLYDVQVRYYDRRRGRHWTPRNADGRLRGEIPLAEAHARSLNNATIRLLGDVGVARVVDFARRAGIRSPLAEDLGLALGTSGVSLAELVAAYRTFAAGGERRAPCFVRRVLDRDGRVVLTDLSLLGDEDAAPEQVISPIDAYLVTDLLRGTVAHWYGTGHAAARLGTVAGKTGSTNEHRDAWFVGFSPSLAAGVWIGHDHMEPLGRRETGARAALPIWIDFMAQAAGEGGERFPIPEGVHFAALDPETGELQRSTRPYAGWQPFAPDRPPRRSTPVPVPKPEPAAPAEPAPALRELAAGPPQPAALPVAAGDDAPVGAGPPAESATP